VITVNLTTLKVKSWPVRLAILSLFFPLFFIWEPASADTGGYPDADATDCSATFGLYSWCKNGTDNSSRGYGYRNCTDYVAWKLDEQLGIEIPHDWHSAENWETAAVADGYSLDTSPRVGDIAQWDTEKGGGYGHVAYVFAVNNGIASLDEYNVAGTGLFTSNRTTASGSAGAPDHYIHIADVESGGSGGTNSTADGMQYIESSSGGVDVSSFNSSGSNWNLQKRVGPWAPPVAAVAGDFAGSGSNNSLAYVTANTDGTVTMATLKSSSTGWSKIYQTGHWGRPIALISGDFSNDGKDDTVAYFESTGNGTAQVSVFKSKGASGWTLLWRATGWGAPQAVVSGDFDNDGKDNDLAYVEGNADGTSRVSTIHSTGSSWSKIHQTGEWSPVYKVVAGDFAGTGKKNSIVYVSRNADGTVDLDTMKSSGTSGWSSVWGEAGWQAPTQLATVNFNHDSEDDLFYVEPYGSGTKVSTFTSTGTNWGVGWQRTSWGPPVMVVGDFDN
jgi:surface antigen